MADLSDTDLEINAIQEAYDALKCLDDAGRQRALEWLWSKFQAEEFEGRKARRESARKRLSESESRE